jgi:thioredoxin reductase
VIVVGANLLGISATVRLMQAGLRVLLVDRQSWAPLDSPAHRLLASRPGVARRMRLPLVTGHHVSVVAQRADGMLELQAERAAWYTANVIFASREVAAPIGERTNALGTPLVACTPASSRAA